MRDCIRCKGTGSVFYSYNNSTSFCPRCNGNKFFGEVNETTIESNIKGRNGMRTSKPKLTGNPINDDRSYYVWRMVRFHAGIDVTMPMWAQTIISADPFCKELDVLVDALALKWYGTNMAAARRWKGLI